MIVGLFVLAALTISALLAVAVGIVIREGKAAERRDRREQHLINLLIARDATPTQQRAIRESLRGDPPTGNGHRAEPPMMTAVDEEGIPVELSGL